MKYNIKLFYLNSKVNKSEIINTFNLAFNENKNLALANLLYILDIRNGKGERRVFKTIFKYLCNNEEETALQLLPFIGELGRYDYLLEGLNTPVEKEITKLIKNRLKLDLISKYPSLLAKWLPSLRTHKKNNTKAKKLVKLLNMKEKEYRKLLSFLRRKVYVVEKFLSSKYYYKIDFKYVPVKAFFKYERVFKTKLNSEYLNNIDKKAKRKIIPRKHMTSTLKKYINMLNK